MKKRWKKPELQVLIRGKIEESVLCHCKTGKKLLQDRSQLKATYYQLYSITIK